MPGRWRRGIAYALPQPPICSLCRSGFPPCRDVLILALSRCVCNGSRKRAYQEFAALWQSDA